MRIGVVGYLAKTGIGIMVDDFAEKLGAVAQLVIPHDKAEDLVPSNDRRMVRSNTWIPPLGVVDEFADLVDVVISVESDWGGTVYPRLRERGVKVVLLPMFEWWNPSLPMNKHIDLFICTTKQCYNGIPFKSKVFIPCPVDTHKIKYRQRSGEPRLFVHNAGNLGIGGRKGTLEVVRAFINVDDRAVSLKINSQVPLPESLVSLIDTDQRISLLVKNHENYADLYDEGDMLIYTPHYDGQALVSAEAMAAGLPVITIDAPPMNEHWMIYDDSGDDHEIDAGIFCSIQRTANAQTLNPESLCYYVNELDLQRTVEAFAINDLDIPFISAANREIAEKCFSWDVCLPFYKHYLEVACNTNTR